MVDQGLPSGGKNTSVRPYLAGFLTAVALLGVALLVWPRTSMSPAMRPPGPQGADPLAVQVADETAKLGLRPHTRGSSLDKALAATQALRRGDYRATELLARDVLARSKLQAFSFHPFNEFLRNLSDGGDPQYLAGLDAWILHSPNSALAHLMRAEYYRDTAWLVRGSDFDSAVPEEHKQRFAQLMNRAQQDVEQVTALEPNLPIGYYLRLRVSADLGDSQRLDEVFRDSIAHFPNYYALYSVRLTCLEPKWGGSVDAMYQFVARYAGSAPPDSPLKLLYLELTANLLNAAWVQCERLQHEILAACVNTRLNQSVRPALASGVSQAVNIYKHTDPIEFSSALWPILGDMAGTPGNSTLLNTVLQLAAAAMGSDNQLIHESGHNNSYVLDDITARAWSNLDNQDDVDHQDNVDQKFQEALQDVERTRFANEEDKEVALAAIYEDMAWAARRSSQYAKVIVYHDAANTVAGANHGGSRYLKCFAYYKLRHFKEAVDECSRLIDSQRDVWAALNTRAEAYAGLRNYDGALADYTRIAEDGSDNYLRDGAVINMDHINALRGHYATELEIFDKYPFVFDAQLQAADDLAVVYNNRCFAYMKLGKLDQALADCTASLKYGRLPDALAKEQQLQQMLSARTN